MKSQYSPDDEFITLDDMPDIDVEIFGEDIHVRRDAESTAGEPAIRTTQQDLMDQLLAEMAELKRRLYEVEERLFRLEHKS